MFHSIDPQNGPFQVFLDAKTPGTVSVSGSNFIGSDSIWDLSTDVKLYYKDKGSQGQEIKYNPIQALQSCHRQCLMKLLYLKNANLKILL